MTTEQTAAYIRLTVANRSSGEILKLVRSNTVRADDFPKDSPKRAACDLWARVCWEVVAERDAVFLARHAA